MFIKAMIKGNLGKRAFVSAYSPSRRNGGRNSSRNLETGNDRTEYGGMIMSALLLGSCFAAQAHSPKHSIAHSSLGRPTSLPVKKMPPNMPTSQCEPLLQLRFLCSSSFRLRSKISHNTYFIRVDIFYVLDLS